MTAAGRTPWWAWAWPLLAWAILLVAKTVGSQGPVIVGESVVLIATVFAAVYHAEVVAHRIGEPFGSLVLAVAVTVIEVALIVSIMISVPGKEGLARDSVFAVVMIVCNGIVGICLLAGGMRHREQGFQIQGASAALAVLAALTVLSLVLPNVTTSANGPEFSTPQLVFAGAVSLVLYAAFVFIQTVRHRDYFLPIDEHDADGHAPVPSVTTTLVSTGLLLVALAAIVGLAKTLTPTVETLIEGWGAPKAVVGIIIAALVVMPEGLTAMRAARANRLQTSLNLALGSALASIGLTIPAVAAVAILLNQRLVLGLNAKDEVLLALTLLLGVITLGTGRTTVLQGIIHLVVFAAFLFLAIVP
jgi:Ca2+:H+ antiporter